MCAILKKYGKSQDCVIFCSDIPLLRRIQEKGFKVGFLEIDDNRDTIMENLNACIRNKIDSYVMFMPYLLTKSIVKTCHENNMIVGAYKVREKKEAKRLKKLNVDFMFNYGRLLK